MQIISCFSASGVPVFCFLQPLLLLHTGSTPQVPVIRHQRITNYAVRGCRGLELLSVFHT